MCLVLVKHADWMRKIKQRLISMPVTLHSACLQPGCPNYATAHGYCAQHQRAVNTHSVSRSKQGYDRVWQRFRAWYLGQHPLCVECERGGVVALADHLHHKIPLAEAPDLRLDENNVEGLCKSCHMRKSMEERKRYGGARG